MIYIARLYDEGTYDSLLWDGQERLTSGGGAGFINTGADAASLWRKRREEIESLAQQRTRPRVMTGARP